MGEIWQDLIDPGNIWAHLSYIFLITSMMMTSLRSLRVLALLSGLAAMIHFVFRTQDNASLVWEGMFVLANACQLALLMYRSRRGFLRAEELALMQQVLQVEEPAQQRRLLDVIEWRDEPVDTVLMREGQAKPPLIYIAGGAAAILKGDKIVGVCGAGDFLGEMSMISGAPASATVSVTNIMRVARFDRDALVQLSQAMPELSRAFERALNRGLAAKVLRMNDALAAREG